MRSHGLDDVVVLFLRDGALAQAEEQSEACAAASGNEEKAAEDDFHARGEDAASFEDFAFGELVVGSLFAIIMDSFFVSFFVEVEDFLDRHLATDRGHLER